MHSMNPAPFSRRLIAALVLLLGSASPGRADEIPPLNDPVSSSRLPGKIVWMDLFTPDPGASAAFYQSILGWTATPISRDGRTYTVLRNHGRPVAGIVQRPVNGAAPSTARWLPYFSVTSVPRALASIKEAGGKELAPARDFPRRGTQALALDDEGAVFGILHSSSGDELDYAAEAGDLIWAELLARNPATSATFYRRLFGFEVSFDPSTPRDGHFVLSSDGYARAGIAPLPRDDGARPGWIVFLRVGSVDTAAAAAGERGGRVLITPRRSPVGNPYAIVADPAGAVFGLVQIELNLVSRKSP